MKNRLSKPMLAIMLAPFALTLMANSTAPFPFRNEYNDFTYTLVEQRYVEDPTQQADPYTYLEFEVTNTGEEYACQFYVECAGREYSARYASEGETGPVFYDGTNHDETYSFIAPGSSKRLWCKLSKINPDQLGDNIKLHGCYLTKTDSFTLTEAKLSFGEELTSSYQYNYIYLAEFTYTYTSDEEDNLLLFTISYHGEEQCFLTDSVYRDNGKTIWDIWTKEEINLDEATISNVTLLKAKAIGGGLSFEKDKSTLGTLEIVGICALIVLAPALIVGIVLLVSYLINKNKKQEIR